MPGEALIAPLQAIEEPHLMLVEGRDDEILFRALLEHLPRRDVAVRPHWGRTGLRRYLDALRSADGFDELQTLTVVRDADNDCDTALQSVCDALLAYRFDCPSAPLVFTDSSPRVAAIIMPCGERTGSLEGMCLAAVADDPAMPCVRQYAECLDGVATLNLCTNRAKLLVNAFLASRRDPSLKIGEAAGAQVWNWDHPAWQPLISFIRNM